MTKLSEICASELIDIPSIYDFVEYSDIFEEGFDPLSQQEEIRISEETWVVLIKICHEDLAIFPIFPDKIGVTDITQEFSSSLEEFLQSVREIQKEGKDLLKSKCSCGRCLTLTLLWLFYASIKKRLGESWRTQ